jgi:hypothetical protein
VIRLRRRNIQGLHALAAARQQDAIENFTAGPTMKRSAAEFDLSGRHRGMAGVVREGRFANGAIYGCRSVTGEPDRLGIDPREATIVQRLFREYVDGASCRSTATPPPGQSPATVAPPPTFGLASDPRDCGGIRGDRLEGLLR